MQLAVLSVLQDTEEALISPADNMYECCQSGHVARPYTESRYIRLKCIAYEVYV